MTPKKRNPLIWLCRPLFDASQNPTDSDPLRSLAKDYWVEYVQNKGFNAVHIASSVVQPSPTGLEELLAAMECEWDWVVCTSRFAVDSIAQARFLVAAEDLAAPEKKPSLSSRSVETRVSAVGLRDIRIQAALNRLAQTPFATVGQATADSVRRYNYKVELTSDGSGARSLGDTIAAACNAKERILLLLSDKAPDTLQNALQKFETTRINIYETKSNPGFEKLAEDNAPDVVLFTSPSGFSNFISVAGLADFARKVKLWAIGATTSAAMEKAGYTVEAILEKPTPQALVDLLNENYELS